MVERRPSPGVSREGRISQTGLERRESHLQGGVRIGSVVLAHWIKR